MAAPFEIVERSSTLPVSAEEAFAWHERPGAFERLIPPWERVTVLERSGGIREGARTAVSVRIGPARFRWVAVHRDYVEGRRFVDEQVGGPVLPLDPRAPLRAGRSRGDAIHGPHRARTGVRHGRCGSCAPAGAPPGGADAGLSSRHPPGRSGCPCAPPRWPTTPSGGHRGHRAPRHRPDSFPHHRRARGHRGEQASRPA